MQVAAGRASGPLPNTFVYHRKISKTPQVTPAPIEMRIKDSQPDPRWALHSLITGHYLSRAVYVAAKLGIADLLKSGCRTSADLAAATHSHAPSLHRLMLLLASAGVFAETAAGCFRLTAIGERLQSGTPGSLHAEALLFAGPYQQRAWSRLLDIVQTGQHPTSHTLFSFLTKHPEEAAVFDAAMAAKTESVAGAFLAAYDCSRFSKIVELGAGLGSLLRAILKTNPTQRGILFDLPEVVERAREHVRRDGLADRCEVMGGDFFDVLPRHADAYILKNVLHNWDDSQAAAILRNVALAMAPNAAVLLVEMVVPPQSGNPWSEIIAGSDLNMLVNSGGQERSEVEFQRLFEATGLELTRVASTDTPWSVLEAIRRPRAATHLQHENS